ncbi:hypothetical protein [Halomicrococcus sp. SG-WS-1]|uniref:hypothetical protein n=1 Tax=Halomicrococcus sp. SG-WS-1 TaxID=3439057 RepID=UPI003F7B0955
MFETTLRYKNLNDRNIVEGHPEYYDSVLIQAHLLAYSKKAVPQLIRDMADERSFNYYIDPMLSDFRIGTNFRNDDGDVRGWHSRFVNQLGEPLKSVLAERPNAAANELPDNTLQEITKSVVKYQENFVYQRLQEATGKSEDVEINRRDVQPKAVIPWVHKIERVEDIQTVRELISYADEIASLPLKPCLYTTTGFVRDTTNRSLLTDLLGEFDVSECFLVFEELDKYETTQSEYTTVIDFVYDLQQSNIKPHFYYGDFFSNLLAYFGLGGTAYATLFDEEFKEKTEYSGGGGLPPRYYVDSVKDLLKIDTTVDLMNRVGAPMCECQFCSRQFDTWQDIADREQSEEALKPTLKKHRVAIRWEHARLVEEESLEDVLEGLDENFSKMVMAYSASPHVAQAKNVQYLPKWINAVKDRKELAVDSLQELPYIT